MWGKCRKSISVIRYGNSGKFSKFASNSFIQAMQRDYNRIKVVLAEIKRLTNGWQSN